MINKSKLTDVDGIGWDNTSDHSIMYYKGRPFNGIIAGCSGKDVDYKAHVVNGKMHGEELSYYSNEELHFKRNWNNGILDGEEIVYNSKGDTVQCMNYINGKLDGKVIKFERDNFYDNGLLFVRDYKNGYEDGDFICYYDNGNVRRKGHFVGGLKDGEELTYDYEGNLESKKMFKLGKLISCKGYCPAPGLHIDDVEDDLGFEMRQIRWYVDGYITSKHY
jgi:antitoxin component YwqK of YwqJK toxin-antitoxin module